jgi:hypothetical protein
MQRGRKVHVEYVRNDAHGRISNAEYIKHSTVFSVNEI